MSTHFLQYVIYVTYMWYICAYIVHMCTYFRHICVFRMDMSLVGACPAGWWFYERTFACFYLSTVTMSQTDAYAECQSMGAELASFADQTEMDFVTSLSSVPTSFLISQLYLKQTSNKTAVKELDTATFA